MTRPTRYLIRMGLFLGGAIAVAALLTPKMMAAFLTNPYLNGLIVAVLVGGVFYTLRQVARLRLEINWIEGFRRSSETGVAVAHPPLLAPLAAMVESSGSLNITTMTMRSLVDGVAGRLDERRDYSRYMVGLLVFLGLLGTFWGLLTTISAIGQTIGGLTVTSGDVADMFETLKAGLDAPLSGMGTAFSSSLFGLAGSLVLGFLDLTLGQAQGRFLGEMEDWLAAHTRLVSAPSEAEEREGGSAYSSALMTQTADAIDSLERRIAGGNRENKALTEGLTQLNQTLAQLSDELSVQRKTLSRMSEDQRLLAQAIQSMSQGASHDRDEALLTHLRNMELAVKGLAQSQHDSAETLGEELHSSFQRLGRTIGALLDQNRQKDS